MTLLERAAYSDEDIVRANAIEALVRLQARDRLEVYAAAADADSPLVRFAGLVALGELRAERYLSVVRKRTADSDERVRLAAAFAAARCGDASSTATLVRTLERGDNTNLRCDAALLIGKLGEKKAGKRLSFAAQRERSNIVLVHIYAAQAALGDARALDRLINYTQGDSVSRLVAMQSLYDLRALRARDALLYRFNDEADHTETRLVAARALGAVGVRAGYDLALKSLDFTGEPNDQMRVRSLAALTLGAIGDPAALGVLQKLAESESDPRTQVAACLAIGQIVRRPS